MMNAIVKIYARSIRRGARTIEDVPEAIREAVAAALADGT